MYWEIPSMLAVRFRWVSMTPFGSPVVPEVNMISTRSSGCNVHVRGWGHVGDGFFQLLEGNLRDAVVDVSFRSETLEVKASFGLGARDYPLNVVGRAAEVEGNDDDAGSHAPEEDEHPVGGVWSPEDYLVSLCQAAALEQGGHFPGLVPTGGSSSSAGIGIPA